MSNIKLKNHNWHTRGVYDSALAATQEEINAALSKIYKSASVTGNLVSFTADSAGLPLKEAITNFLPVQAAGTPTPSNPIEITGYTAFRFFRAGKNLFGPGDLTFTGDYTWYGPIQLDEPGTYTLSGIVQSNDTTASKCGVLVYYGNGTNSGLLQVPRNTRFSVTLNVPDNPCRITIIRLYSSDNSSHSTGKTSTWSDIQLEKGSSTVFAGYALKYECDISAVIGGTLYGGSIDLQNGILTKTWGDIASYNGETLPGAWLSSMDVYSPGGTPTTGAHVVYELAAPVVYHIPPQEVTTVLGENKLWSVTNSTVKVTYGAYLEAINDHVNRTGDELRSLTESVAPVENGPTSSRAYSQGAYFILKGKFCKAKTAIASGAAFTLNTNYEVTTVAAELIALNALQILIQPEDVSVASGASFTVSVLCNLPNVSYQWQYYYNNAWTNWVGGNSRTLTKTANSAWNGWKTRVICTDSTNSGNTVTSNEITLTVT